MEWQRLPANALCWERGMEQSPPQPLGETPFQHPDLLFTPLTLRPFIIKTHKTGTQRKTLFQRCHFRPVRPAFTLSKMSASRSCRPLTVFTSKSKPLQGRLAGKACGTGLCLDTGDCKAEFWLLLGVNSSNTLSTYGKSVQKVSGTHTDRTSTQ